MKLANYLIAIFFLTLISCANSYHDDFYLDIDDYNRTFIPILKPYKIVAFGNSDKNIFMEMQTDSVDSQINTIKAISVFDSLIYIKSENEHPMPDDDKKYFVIEYFYGNEMGFYSETNLLEYTDSKNYPRPIWKEVWTVYDEIKAKGYPWNIELDSMYLMRNGWAKENIKKRKEKLEKTGEELTKLMKSQESDSAK